MSECSSQLIITASGSNVNELPPYSLHGFPSPAPGTGVYYPFYLGSRLASSFQFMYKKDTIEDSGAIQVCKNSQFLI